MRARTNVILAGKCGSRRHTSTGASENAVVAKTSYEILGILSFSDRESILPPSTEISVLAFVVKKKYNGAFRGVFFQRIARKFKIKCRYRSRPCM